MPNRKWIGLVCSSLALAAAGFVAGCDDQDPVPANTAATTENTTTKVVAETPPTPEPPKPVQPPRPPVHLRDAFVTLDGPVNPDPTLAKVIQTLPLFNRPTSTVVSIDGKYLFVTSSGATLNGGFYYKGGIAKLEIQPDGRLKMLNPKFVTNMHTPMGIDVLPKATKRFPAGSLFVATGTTSGCDDKGDRITDIKKFNPGVTIIDPENGAMIGFIPMGTDRAVARSLYHPVLAPAGLCFDPDGNLYVCDLGNTGKELEPAVFGRPGIMRIKARDIDSYCDDKPAGDVAYYGVHHEPAAVIYSKADDCLYWTTSDGKGPEGGAVYRMPRKNFPESSMRQVILGDQNGPLMGLAITPNGTLLASRLDGDLAFITNRVLDTVRFQSDASFSSPAEIKCLELRPGYTVVYVPEQEPNSLEQWSQRLRVVLMPTKL